MLAVFSVRGRALSLSLFLSAYYFSCFMFRRMKEVTVRVCYVVLSPSAPKRIHVPSILGSAFDIWPTFFRTEVSSFRAHTLLFFYHRVLRQPFFSLRNQACIFFNLNGPLNFEVYLTTILWSFTFVDFGFAISWSAKHLLLYYAKYGHTASVLVKKSYWHTRLLYGLLDDDEHCWNALWPFQFFIQ